MIFADHIVYDAIAGFSWIKWPIVALIIVGVIFFGWKSQQGHKKSAKAVPVEESI
jgi:hypothetical protein